MTTKFWCKELLMIKPDPAPYLLAAKSPTKVKLLAAPRVPLYYTNTGRFVIDQLSGVSLGTSSFELKFDVNLATITQGTTVLLNAPGLMDCIAQNETLHFKFEWDAPWYRLDKQYLVPGWNTVRLYGSGSEIILSVNEYSTTLVYTKDPITTSILYSGFSASNYITLKQPFASYNSYDIIIPVYVLSNTETQPIIAKNNADVTMYVQGSSKCLRMYPSGTVVSSDVMNNGAYYWTRLVYDGTNSSAYVAVDDHTLNASALPDVSSSFWKKQAYVSGDKFKGNAWQIGHNGYTDLYWRGSIDIGRSLLMCNEEVFADGSIPGSFDNQFNISTQLDTTTKSYYPPYPSLTVGQISSPVSWTKVRNISAVLLSTGE